MYKKICVAVDGSESSFAAVASVARLAVSLDAELLILHVIRNMKVPSQLKRFVKHNSLERLRHEALDGAGQEIINHAIKVAQDMGVAHSETSIIKGDPATAIVRTAQECGCDLITVGSRGLGEVEGLLLGSISRKITSIANMNVLVIK